MRKLVSFSTIICCIGLLFISCAKEYSGSAVPKESKFIIAPTNGCSDINIDHNYFTGETITDPDNFQIQVDVLEIGEWTYQTETINGIVFSGGGSFGEKGLQYISVAPQGRAVLPGNYVYTIKEGSSQINMLLSVVDRNFEPEAVPSDPYYYKLVFDNIGYHIPTDNNDPIQQVGMWSPGLDSGGVGVGLGPIAYPSPPGTGTISMQKNHLGMTNPALTDQEFKDFFKPGTYRIAMNACGLLTDGFTIFWDNSDSYTWSTFYGNNQEGSYIKIVGQTDGYNSKGEYFVKLKLRFKCKLYSYPSGQMKQMNDGEMVAEFVRYK